MRRVLSILLVGLVAACSDSDSPDARISQPDAGAPDAAPATPDANIVARGAYLVNTALACIDCHTPRLPSGAFDMSKHMSGVDCFVDIVPGDDNAGCVSSRNLTPHATGLGTTSADLIKRAFTTGERPAGGSFLTPVMPYWLLNRLTAADQDAIVAYLKSLPAVDHQIQPTQPPLANPPAAAPPVADSMFPAAGGTGAAHDSAVRGRYLATMICVDCHTPDAQNPIPYPIDLAKPFWGNRAFPIGPPFPDVVYSANLTPHATGLAGWTVAQVVTALKMGKDNEGAGLCPPMPAGPMGPFKDMTDADATDIANYLLNLEPHENTLNGTCEAPGPYPCRSPSPRAAAANPPLMTPRSPTRRPLSPTQLPTPGVRPSSRRRASTPTSPRAPSLPATRSSPRPTCSGPTARSSTAG